MKQQQRRLGAVALHMDEMDTLAIDVSREVRPLIKGALDFRPIVGIPPIGGQAFEVIDTNTRLPPSRIGQLAPVIGFHFACDGCETFGRYMDRVLNGYCLTSSAPPAFANDSRPRHRKWISVLQCCTQY